MLVFKPEDVTLHGMECKGSNGFFATNLRKPGYISFRTGRCAMGNTYCDFTLDELKTLVQMFEASSEHD